MADMRKATLSVTVAADAALKNLQSIKTQFQSLDKLGTKSLTSSLNTSIKATKELSTQLRGSGAKEFAGDIADAQDQVKDLGYTGVQSGGLITNSFKKLSDGVGGLVGKLGGIKGALAGLGITAVLGGMVYSAASAQIDKQGALAVAKQRGWHDAEIKELEAFMNKRNDYVSKADVYLFAQRSASYSDNTEEIAASLDAETKLFANNMGRLRDKGITSVMELDEAIKAGDETVLQGILNIKAGDLTQDVVNKAIEAANRETGGPGAAGWDAARKKYETYYKYQAGIAEMTKDMTIDPKGAAASMMAFNKTLSDLQTTLGEQLLPTVTALLEWINNLVKAMGPGLTSLTAVGAGVIGIVAILAMLAPGLAMLAAPLKLIFGILGGATPLGLLITGLIIVVPLLYAWANKMGYVTKAADWLNKLDLGTKLTNTLKFIWEGIISVGIILQEIYDLFKRFVGWILGGVANIIKWIIDIPNKLGEIFTEIKTVLTSLPEKIKEALGFGGAEGMTPEQKAANAAAAEEVLKNSGLGLSDLQAHALANPEDKYFVKLDPATRQVLEATWLSASDKTAQELIDAGFQHQGITYDEKQQREAIRAMGGAYAGSGLAAVPDVPTGGQAAASVDKAFVSMGYQPKLDKALKDNSYLGMKEATPGLGEWAGFYYNAAKNYIGEKAQGLIPMASGGLVNADGILKVHAGERILSESDVQRGGGSGGNVTVHMTINNPMFTDSASMHKFDQHVRDIINRENLVHMTNKRGRGTIA